MFSKIFSSEIKNSILHSSVLISGSFIAQLISVLAYPLLTRLFSVSEFGEFSVFLSITGILTILATGRMEYAIMLPEIEKEASELKRIGVYWCICCSLICFIAALIIAQLKLNKVHGLYLISIAVLLSGLIQLFTFYQNRQKKYKTLAKISVFQTSMATGSKLLFGFLHLSRYGMILGSIIGQIAGLIALPKRSWGNIFISKPLDWAVLRKYAGFPKYRLPQALINSLSTNMPILFLTFYFSAREAGYFALVFGLTMRVINIISAAIYQVLYQRFSEYFHKKKSIYSFFKKIIVFLFLVSIIPGCIAFIFSDQLVVLFLGKSWLNAGIYLKIIIPWLTLVFIASPLSFIADIFSRQKITLRIDLVSLMIRTTGLFLGYLYHNFYLSILLFSIGSFGIQLYLILWYRWIIRNS